MVGCFFKEIIFEVSIWQNLLIISILFFKAVWAIFKSTPLSNLCNASELKPNFLHFPFKTEGEKLAKGIDSFIEVLEEEEAEEAAAEEELEDDIIAYKEAESPDSLLQQVETPHLPENQEISAEEKLRLQEFGKKPSSITS